MKATYRVLLNSCLLMFLSCSKPSLVGQTCLKGKYLGDYCEGAVFQLSASNSIGRTWKSMYSDLIYENCVVASFDTIAFKNAGNPFSTSTDSTFYFHYQEGGYPRKQYNICEPSAFITITSLTTTPCPDSSR